MSSIEDIRKPRYASESLLGRMRTGKAWFFIILGLGLAVRLALIFQPLESMLAMTLPDDAFYYFVIARNAAKGVGFTFDRIQPTNGFHPLWAAILIPIFGVFRDGGAAIRAVLVLSALLDVGTAIILAKIAEGILRKSGSVVAGIYLFNPRLVMESVNGLETSLGMLFLAAFLLISIMVYQEDRWREWALLGFISGLTFLARTDLIVVMVVVVVALIRERWRGSKGRAEFKGDYERFFRVLGKLALAGCLGLLVISPWLVWNMLRFGTLLQSSAVAMPSLVRYRLDQGGDVWNEIFWPATSYGFRALLLYPGVSWIILSTGFVFSKLAKSLESPKLRASLIFNSSTPSNIKIIPYYILWAPVLGATMLTLIHAFLRLYPRGWYFVPVAGSVALAAGLVITKLSPSIQPKVRKGFIALILLILSVQVVHTANEAAYPGQVEALQAAVWIRENSPPDTIAGSFNAGILAYFSDREIVNLDGVVDWRAIQERNDHQLLSYLVQRGGSYLVDHKVYIWNFFGLFLGPEAELLHEVRSFGEDETGIIGITIYEVEVERE